MIFRYTTALSTLVFLLIAISNAYADTITKPNTFSAGNPAVAADVNANFDTVYDQVNKMGGEIEIDDVNGRVGIGTATPGAKLDVNGSIIRTISYATGNGPPDGTDVGQIVSRVLNFTKAKAATDLRITYNDNYRVYVTSGISAGCRWEVKIDGQSCPQPLINDAYTYSQTGFLEHWQRGSLLGYCSGISAGAHQVQVWVGPMPTITQGDCYTSSPRTSTWVIEVEEMN